MSKITRAIQKIFGSSASAGQIGKFGSLAAGTAETTTDPATIQSLANYLQGWHGAVLGNNSPAIEDRNAIDHLVSRQLAYIFQQGIPEWEISTEYHIGSIVQDGSGNVLLSLSDNNTGNEVTDATNWKPLVSDSYKYNLLYNAEFLLFQENFASSEDSPNRCDTGVYYADQWISCTDSLSNDFWFGEAFSSTMEASPSKSSGGVFITNNTAGSNYYLGTTQVLPSMNKLRGKKVVLNASLGNLVTSSNEVRVAIIQWKGAANSFDRDPVQTWSAAPTNPTLKANWSYVAISDSFDPSTGVVGPNGMKETSLTGVIDSDAENVGIFIFGSQNYDGDLEEGFVVGNVSLERGTYPTDFDELSISFDDNYEQCKKFFQKTYPLHMFSGATMGDVVWRPTRGAMFRSASLTTLVSYRLPVRMIKTPAVTLYALDGTVNEVSVSYNSGTYLESTVTSLSVTSENISFQANGTFTGRSAYEATSIEWHHALNAQLGV